MSIVLIYLCGRHWIKNARLRNIRTLFPYRRVFMCCLSFSLKDHKKFHFTCKSNFQINTNSTISIFVFNYDVCKKQCHVNFLLKKIFSATNNYVHFKRLHIVHLHVLKGRYIPEKV